MYRLDVRPAAGALASANAWQAAPDVTVAVTGVRLDEYEPGETLSAEVFVSLELADGESRTFVPSFGGLVEHACEGCGHDGHREFLPRAMWQPVLVRRDGTASDA